MSVDFTEIERWLLSEGGTHGGVCRQAEGFQKIWTKFKNLGYRNVTQLDIVDFKR